MTSFISAGHNTEGNRDPGAMAGGRIEAEETIRFRDMVVRAMKERHPGVKVITDQDHERLAEYLKRIQTGSGSVVVEYHLDAFRPTDRGTTVFYSEDADKYSRNFAKELADSTAMILGIPNRGARPESATGRGRLGLMREAGIVALVELGFITNDEDMKALDDDCKAKVLAEAHADIIAKYEKLI